MSPDSWPLTGELGGREGGGQGTSTKAARRGPEWVTWGGGRSSKKQVDSGGSGGAWLCQGRRVNEEGRPRREIEDL